MFFNGAPITNIHHSSEDGHMYSRVRNDVKLNVSTAASESAKRFRSLAVIRVLTTHCEFLTLFSSQMLL